MQAEQSALQQLSFQKDIAKPFELLQLEVLEKRTNLSTDDKKLLWVQRMGYQGERIFFEFITRYAKQHWKVLYRTWLSVNGRLECDFIIITRVGVYFLKLNIIMAPLFMKIINSLLISDDSKEIYLDNLNR